MISSLLKLWRFLTRPPFFSVEQCKIAREVEGTENPIYRRLRDMGKH